ncbi:hypothetical protein [Lactococcus lactis]|nr:hypothetical protein [Lactococcus lactis]
MSTRLELAEQKLARLKNEFASKKSPMDEAPLGFYCPYCSTAHEWEE